MDLDFITQKDNQIIIDFSKFDVDVYESKEIIKLTLREQNQPTNSFQWGLGVEHELILVFSIDNTLDNYINIIETFIQQKLNRKQIQKINQLLKKYNKTLKFVVPYYKNINLDFVNQEKTSKNKIRMYEIKTTKYKNVTIKELVEELDSQKRQLTNKVEKYLEDKFQLKIKVDETPYGSAHLLFFENFRLDTHILPKFNELKLSSDYTGSYHFWITLPYKEKNQIAMYLLQTLEPLFSSIFCSPDPKITIDNKPRFSSSFRFANNYFAGFGSSSIYDYDSLKLKERKVKYKDIKPRKIDDETYIDIVIDKLLDSMDDDEYFDYLEFMDIPHNKIGTDFRRREEIEGFEFRIFDHFPQKYLESILEIIYLVSCYSYQISNKGLELSIENKGWNQSMANSLLDGYQMKIPLEYIKFISRQFKINKKNLKNQNSLELLSSILIILNNSILDVKENLYHTISNKNSLENIIIQQINADFFCEN